MDALEAAKFYGDFSYFHEEIQKLLSEEVEDTMAQEEISS